MPKILIEKVRDDSPFAGALSAGHVVDTGEYSTAALMREGLVFCMAPDDAEIAATIGDETEAPVVTGEAEDDAPGFDLTVLDQSTVAIAAEIPTLAPDHLRALLAAEANGKTRKGVTELLTAAIAAAG